MVKKWIIMLSILIILIVGCIFESKFINQSFVFLEEQLRDYKQVIENTKEDEIGTSNNVLFIQSLHEKWHGKMVGLKSLIWHSGIKDIEVGLSRIEVYTKEQDRVECLAEINCLIDYLDHYSDDFVISIENIL